MIISLLTNALHEPFGFYELFPLFGKHLIQEAFNGVEGVAKIAAKPAVAFCGVTHQLMHHTGSFQLTLQCL